MRVWTLAAHYLVIPLLAFASNAAANDDLFEITELSTDGRVVRADFADFDGDGRKDLLIATLSGIPPAEARTLHVYLRNQDGNFPAAATHAIPIPPHSVVYDIADVMDVPGEELVLLRPDRVTFLSLADGAGRQQEIPIDGPTTVGPAVDERGFDRMRLVYDQFAAEPWLVVPQFGRATAVNRDGEPRAVLDIGGRANYFVTRDSGLLSVETDIQVYYDAPKIVAGDIDGDGRADIAAITRHEIRVFLQNADGGFDTAPSYALPIGLISKEDHARGGGSIVTRARDLDNDQRLDLMISHSEGTFTNAVTKTCVYHNRTGRWDLSEPEECFQSKGAFSSDLLLDLDSDDALELVRVEVRFSVLEVVEFLLTRELDVMVSVHRLKDDGLFDMKPWSKRKISTEISFDTFRPKGFMPTSGIDLNADGRMDFVSSADGDGIEVYLGTEDGLFSKRRALQKLPSAGIIRFVDFDDDSLADFVLWDPQAFDSIVRIGRNTGALAAE